MEHIRAYNQMFAMMSFGAKVDDSVNKGRGPYVFKISCQIYHWIGSLCLEEGDHPCFLQQYIYDTRNEVRNRMQHFSGVGESAINPEIVQGLIHVLDEHNGLVRMFRTARDRCIVGEIPTFKIRLYNMSDVRGYELPTADLLGGIVFEDGLRRFYPELQLKPRDGRGKGEKVTMNAYYRYQLHPRVKEFGFIFRSDLTSADRADVVCRVFEQKVKEFLSFFERSENVWRRFCSVIYNRVSKKRFATLSYVNDPRGYKLVTELMMHGPCGAANSSAACMQEGSYSRHFPKTYNDRTFFDSNGHTHYRRRDTGVHVMKGESKLDNCDVVPYNRALCQAFEAHINVEYCGWSMLIKYLFKYISKGPDRILAKINNSDESTTTGNKPHIDEIQNYVDGRFICPYEACWRIFDFPIHSREPAVQILNVHLENMQCVNFRKSDRLDIIVNLPEKKKITLTEWFVYNNENTDGRHLTYLDFLQNLFGCKSPIDIRTVNGQILLNYRAACEALGLLGDDKEYDTTLEESTITVTSKEAPPQHLLRDLQNKLLMEEKNYKRDLLREEATTLRDLMSAPNVVFEGKTIVLGGDFRQTLAVKKGASKEELIVASITESHLWPHFEVYTLKENMQLLRSGLTAEEKRRSEQFAKWLLDMGNGEIGEPDAENEQESSWVTISPEYTITTDEAGMSELIDFIYDDTTLKAPTAGSLQEKAIVCPKNATADVVNAKILSGIEGQSRTYLRNDEAISLGGETSNSEQCRLLQLHLSELVKKTAYYKPKYIEDGYPKGVHFTCEGMITIVQENRDWKYPSCSECSKASNKLNGTYIYEDHGKQDPVTYMYKFKAAVTDGTATAQFTFFTKAGEKITDHPCSQIRYAPSNQRGAAAFIAVDVLDTQPTIQTEGAGTAVAASSATPSKETAGKEKHITGTPPHDLIEEVAHTIVSTIPAKKSDTEQEKDQNTNARTTTEPKASLAKRSLLSELSPSTKKKKKD
ncbi:DNA helicase [Tanacetum coccineum]